MSSLALALWLSLAPASSAGGAVLVVPPAGPKGAATGWLGALVAELLPRALQRAGVPAVPDEDRRAAQEALGVSAAATTRATSIRVAEALGSSRLVVGSWDERAGETALSLRLLDAERGTLSAPLVGSAPAAGLGGLVHSLAWDVALAGPRPPTGTREALVRAGEATPFEALRALGEGLAAREASARIAGVRRALAAAPDCEEAALALARLLVDSSAFEEARAALGHVRQDSPFSRDARFLEGVALIGLRRFREADVLYAQLVQERSTAAALANRGLARLRAAAGVNGASTLLREAVEVEPASVDLPFDLGYGLLVEGDAPAAVFWLKGAVRRDPADAQGRLALSWALAASGRAAEAEEQWRAAVALTPALAGLRNPDPTRRLERVLVSERGPLLDPERRSDAEEARTRATHGESLLEANDLAGALSELARAALLDPYLARPHLLLARAHRSRGENDKAVEELRMALWCREDPIVRRELADLLRALGRVEEAKRVAG
ncbi:MAG: tetratricopeptide repeat protein [Betaproteobacteria bacterium]